MEFLMWVLTSMPGFVAKPVDAQYFYSYQQVEELYLHVEQDDKAIFCNESYEVCFAVGNEVEGAPLILKRGK